MALDITTLLPNAAHRAKRQALVDGHFGTVHEGNFTGFSASEEAAFTVVQVTSADALLNAMSAAGAGEQKIFECAWNGLSQSAVRVTGIKATSLVANPGVDWGYDRPASAMIVRPATGFAPVLQSTYGTGILYMTGLSRIQFEGMVFEATSLRFSASSTYPAIAMVALKGNTFQNNNGDNGNKFTVHMTALRTMHADGNLFTDCSAAFVGSPNYMRSWNNRFHRMSNNDVHGFRNYSTGMQAGWTAHVWVAGNTVYNMSPANAQSLLHCDFLQISHPGDAHWGYRCLAEFNMVHLDRGGVSPSGADLPGTQGLFGDDGGGYAGEWLIHNNIIMMSAYWACLPWDPTDAQAKVVTRNMFLRAASHPSTKDNYPRIEGLCSAGAAGGGTLEVSDNYGALFSTGKVSGESFSGNVVVSPRVGAAAGTRYQDVLVGNGSWGVDGSGFLTFSSPDAGISDLATARAAIAGFARPQAGWAAVAGPEDPAGWPSGDFANLSGGGAGNTAPVLGGKYLRINVTVA